MAMNRNGPRPARSVFWVFLIFAILCFASIPKITCEQRLLRVRKVADVEDGATGDAAPVTEGNTDDQAPSGTDGGDKTAPETPTDGDGNAKANEETSTGDGNSSGESPKATDAATASDSEGSSEGTKTEAEETPAPAPRRRGKRGRKGKKAASTDTTGSTGGGKKRGRGRKKKQPVAEEMPAEEAPAAEDVPGGGGATTPAGDTGEAEKGSGETTKDTSEKSDSAEEGETKSEAVTEEGSTEKTESKGDSGEGITKEEVDAGTKTEGEETEAKTTGEATEGGDAAGGAKSEGASEEGASTEGTAGTPADLAMPVPKGDIDPKGIPISAKCKDDVRAFRAAMYKDLSLDKDMQVACKRDIIKFCDDDFLYPEPGNVLACLRELKDSQPISDECKAKVFKREQAAAEDFKLDPQLNEQCSADAERLCKGVENGGGRIQECLRNQRDKLQWDCQAELFRQEEEDANDIRLNVRLFQACRNDQLKFCADVKYGSSRVKECLEQHRLDADFSARCKTEFDKMMMARAQDFRLDALLRAACKEDISKICFADEQEMNDVASPDARVVQCLQDYREELTNPECKKRVHIVTARAAEDMRFDRPLSQACYDDRQKLCRDVPDGMAQVFMCLQDKMGELQLTCRRAIFHQLVRFAEDIDFKFPIKRACASELKKFCKNIPQGPGMAGHIKCLQQNLDNAEMGEDCKKEVVRDMARSAEDYRLNYRLHKACLPEIRRICPHVCEAEKNNGSMCGGSVLKCLQEKKDAIEVAECKAEVDSFTQVEAKDPLSFNVPLKKACSDDLLNLCPSIGMDHSRQLACLRGQRDKLSESCKAEELRFSEMEASDIRLTPTLMNACGQELQSYCHDVPPSEGRAFSCLQQHLDEVVFSAACKGEVNLQEARAKSDYRLDVRLAKTCVADIESQCADVDKSLEGHAVVLKCMVGKFDSLASSCQTEVAYSVRMALFQYEVGADLTAPCDDAVKSSCGSSEGAAIDGAVIGKFGQCLLSLPGRKLPKDCQVLVKVASTEGAFAGGTADDKKVQETLERLKELQAQVDAQGGGLVLSGWFAAIAVVALLALLAGVGYGIYYFYINPRRNYTLVVKNAPGTT